MVNSSGKIWLISIFLCPSTHLLVLHYHSGSSIAIPGDSLRYYEYAKYQELFFVYHLSFLDVQRNNSSESVPDNLHIDVFHHGRKKT